VQQVEQYLSISIYLFKMPYQLLSKNKEQKQKENRLVNPDQLQHLRRDLLRRAKVGLSSQTSRRKDRKDRTSIYQRWEANRRSTKHKIPWYAIRQIN
jgi:hypothetical protein